jgi:prophage regulatory protein
MRRHTLKRDNAALGAALVDALVEIVLPTLRAELLADRSTRRAATTADDNDHVVTAKELCKRIPLNRSTISRMVREGRFPAPIQLSASRIGWRWSTVAKWLDERERYRINPRRYFGR